MSKTADELVEVLRQETESKEHEKTRQVLQVLLSELIKSFKQFEIELPQALIEIAKAVKTDIPAEQNVRVMNPKELQAIFKPSERVKIDTQSLKVLTDSLEALKIGIEKIKLEKTTFPTDAKNPISVRLSDGEKFIEQLTQVIHQQAVGGGSVPKITLAGGVQAVPIVNPDGTNLSLSVGDISGVSAYSDSLDTDKKGLVDGDRHVQVDVLTAPTTAVTGTFWQATQPISGTVTANLSATDNAVLDSIDTSTQGILSDTAAIQTAVEILDNAISGSEMQVDVVGALPAGTNAIGKLAANSGVDIGDVTLTAGTAAIGTTLPPDIDVTTHTNYAKKYYTNAGAVTDGIIWSPAAGKRWHVVALHIQVSAACTVTLEDDKAGGDEAIFKAEYAANGGEFLVFPEHYPLASGEDAADLIITTTAGNVYVTAVGYEI